MILLATPTRDSVTAGFTGDLVKLCRRHPDARWIAALGIYIAHLRESAASAAVQAGASHILFLDSDMRFPEDTIDRLLAHERPIVAANYVQRTMPEWWVARADGASLSSVGRTGLQAVESVGFGVILIETGVFKKQPHPWFATPFDGRTYLGEDVAFCQQMRASGQTIWIDHDLSQRVRHSASIEYGVHSVEVEAVA